MDHGGPEDGTAEHADTQRQGVAGAEAWTGLRLGLGRGGGLRLAGGRLRGRLLRGGGGDGRRRPRGLLLRESRRDEDHAHQGESDETAHAVCSLTEFRNVTHSGGSRRYVCLSD
jgi:hypothetical protein